jgi:TolA-binding protein
MKRKLAMLLLLAVLLFGLTGCPRPNNEFVIDDHSYQGTETGEWEPTSSQMHAGDEATEFSAFRGVGTESSWTFTATFAPTINIKGVDVKLISAALGYSETDITMQISGPTQKIEAGQSIRFYVAPRCELYSVRGHLGNDDITGTYYRPLEDQEVWSWDIWDADGKLIHNHEKPDVDGVYKEAREFYNEKAYDKAINAYNIVLQIDPNHKNARAYRATSYYYTKDYESALADYQYYIEKIDQNDWAGYGIGGDCLNKLNRYTEAKEYLDIAINHEFKTSYFAWRSLSNEKLGFFFDASIDMGMAYAYALSSEASEETQTYYQNEFERLYKQVPIEQLQYLIALFNNA